MSFHDCGFATSSSGSCAGSFPASQFSRHPTTSLPTIGRARRYPWATSQPRRESSLQAAWSSTQAARPLNLDADPRASILVGSRVIDCEARRLNEPEADQYWPQLVAAWPAHATYRRRSGQRHTFQLLPIARSLTTRPRRRR
jgi:hypothetical protein